MAAKLLTTLVGTCRGRSQTRSKLQDNECMDESFTVHIEAWADSSNNVLFQSSCLNPNLQVGSHCDQGMLSGKLAANKASCWEAVSNWLDRGKSEETMTIKDI